MAVGQVPKHGFKKGVSGNPSGRPKSHSVFIKLAQAHSVEALERLIELMRQKKSPKIALKAAELILDRAWGKAPQAITGEAGQGPIKLEVMWKSQDVATIDISPQEPPLLEATDATDTEPKIDLGFD
jgi:Family of unknown function (DUF5681)